MKKIKNNQLCSLQGGFDLEDYATTMRATRDAHEKAVEDYTLALQEFPAAGVAYAVAAEAYVLAADVIGPAGENANLHSSMLAEALNNFPVGATPVFVEGEAAEPKQNGINPLFVIAGAAAAIFLLNRR